MILLIDEIDKADLEFPNDLLWELDQMEFDISETGRTVRAKQRPIVIITSNAEKELPDAFLRRCIFHYIEFPDEGLMSQIILRTLSGPGGCPAHPGFESISINCGHERSAKKARHQ